MTTQTMPTPDLYFDTIWGFQKSAALKTAIDLELFTAIDKGARTVSEIAAASGASERGIRILCDYLVTIGFLVKTAGAYSLTPESAAFLSKQSPAYLGTTARFLYSTTMMQEFDQLTDTVRTGTTHASVVTDEHPVWVEFARAMVPMMMPPAHAMADILGVASAGPIRVLDIAAGHGTFGIVIAQRNPQAQVVASDWAPVLTVATEHAQAMGVGDRFQTLPGDSFKVDYGTGFDLVLVPNFLHHFDADANVALLRKVRTALKPGGRVAVLEFVPAEDRISPPMAARFSLMMLASTPRGDAYTLSELREMLTRAGFSNITAHPLEGPQTVIVAS
jgi:2-polyprenyl-3-methyl-5-hydroxy-6-metoxy-1,4-benzoquinol methylase